MIYFTRSTLSVLAAFLSFAISSAIAQTCPSTGSAAPDAPFWMQNIGHRGVMPYNGDAGYKVFRNVKDFGARGDGETDDTEAINSAIAFGNKRCGLGNCPSGTIAPAVVYFPPGTYKVSSPVVAWYFTALIGDAKNPPTLLAAPNFAGVWVIDADPYLGGDAQWYTNQNNFYRSVRNFVVDLRQAPASGISGIHWQVSQATSLFNFRVEMGTGSQHQGMFMENGSGGFMSDLVFNGGKNGIWIGNQQFTVRNLTINDATTGVFAQWNWGWTFQGVTINNAQIAFDLQTGGLTKDTQTVGSEVITDAVINNTLIFIRSSANSAGSLKGSLVIQNARLNNVPIAVAVADGTTILEGGTKTITNWVQGNIYQGTNQAASFVQADQSAPIKDGSLLDSAGRIFGKRHPQYESFDVNDFVSIRELGAKGDGVTDDTEAIQNALNANANCGKIIYFDHGVYYITKTLTIPSGSRLIGEVWPVILAGGSNFQDQANPQVAVKVGSPNESGTVEISDIMFGTRGRAPGAIIMEWNIKQSDAGSAGMWDAHIRIGGTAGTDLDLAHCPTGSQNAECEAAFLALHLTEESSGYFEGTWVWLADHDVEDVSQGRISAFSGRGILSESQGPTWLIGTGSEHHALYQYSLVNAKNHYLGLIQTESPYYQPAPAAPAPFSVNSAFSDPTTYHGSAWGLWVQNSQNILVLGAGLYSFFDNYSQVCLDAIACQQQIANIDSTSTISIYGLSTVGTISQLSINTEGVIPATQNVNGFQQTVTQWTR